MVNVVPLEPHSEAKLNDFATPYVAGVVLKNFFSNVKATICKKMLTTYIYIYT